MQSTIRTKHIYRKKHHYNQVGASEQFQSIPPPHKIFLNSNIFNSRLQRRIRLRLVARADWHIHSPTYFPFKNVTEISLISVHGS